MQFLRSIKSVKALGLAAATAATMVAASITPTMAQAPASRRITFSNQGGYNAEYFVTVQQKSFDGKITNLPTQQTGNMLLGQQRPIAIPAFSHITITGRMSHNRQVFIQRSFRLDDNLCVKNVGTLFNPSATIQKGSC
jgi:phosphate-selective porin